MGEANLTKASLFRYISNPDSGGSGRVVQWWVDPRAAQSVVPHRSNICIECDVCSLEGYPSRSV